MINLRNMTRYRITQKGVHWVPEMGISIFGIVIWWQPMILDLRDWQPISFKYAVTLLRENNVKI